MLRERTQEYLSKHGIMLDPSLDEQQLVDEEVICRLIASSGLAGGDTVLEVGPGIGNITEALLRRAEFVNCVEKNPKYLPILRERFGSHPGFEVVLGDALNVRLPRCDRLVSNLPYMICEAFLQRLFRTDVESAALIVPNGFADILVAEAGTHGYSKLSYQAQLFYTVEVHAGVPRSAYLPEPKTDTCIMSLVPSASSTVADETLKQVFRQGDKLSKNALREALIRVGLCDTKRQAAALIAESMIPACTLGGPVARLSLKEVQSLGDWIGTLADRPG